MIIRIVSSESITGNYYDYKLNSIMYTDSNYVGFFILTLITFYDYLIQENILKKVRRRNIIILQFLNLLTFSKSTIIVMLIRKKIFIKNIFFKILLLIIFLGILMYYFDNSWTLESKFFILKAIITYYKETINIREILFGVGLGNTSNLIGIGPHIILIAAFFETGIIGGVLTLILLRSFYIETQKKAKYIIFPLMISGLTLFPGQIPYFYVILSLISRLEKIKNKIEKKEQKFERNKN